LEQNGWSVSGRWYKGDVGNDGVVVYDEDNMYEGVMTDSNLKKKLRTSITICFSIIQNPYYRQML
jgi:hypothetical protein